jgi:hypothetical protein
MSSAAPPAVSDVLAERFVKAFADFVDAVWVEVTGAAQNPHYSSTPALLAWQTQALPQLERDNTSIQNALVRFQIGETRTLSQLASDQRFLARRLDGFSVAFAGPDRAGTLDQLQTAVVVAAYQLCKAAGIP